MKGFLIKRILFFSLVCLCTFTVCEGQSFRKSNSSNPERALFGKSLNKRRPVKIKEPRSVTRAKNKQEANERKLDKEYSEYVKKSRDRALEIQTPEVRERMINNREESDNRYQIKKKKISEDSKKTRKKFRKY